MMQP
jgi:hypothetical protein